LDLKTSVKERTLKAFLDLEILRLLAHQPITAYQAGNLIVKEFGVIIAPNTVYNKLHTMEREGWVKRFRNRTDKAFTLTEQGQEIVGNLPAIAEEIQQTVRKLLKC
jgi:DNA-binding PadR family transcriptional regulator